MDSILGIGLPELMVVLLLAGLVMGPHRIRQVARTLGRLTAQLQGISREFARQLNAELDALDGEGDVKGAMNDMRTLQEEVKALRRELSRVPKSFIEEGQSTVKEAEAAMKGTDAKKQPGIVQTPTDNEPPDPATDIPASLPNAIEVPGDPD